MRLDQGYSVTTMLAQVSTISLDDTRGPRSYVDCDAPGLTRAATQKYRELYLAQSEDLQNPYARPIIAASHSNLPAVFTIAP